MTTINYRGHEIVTDKDECGEVCVYVYVRDDADPIEIIGGSVSRAKAVIDEMIRDTAEYYGPITADELEYHDSLSASYDF